MVVTENRKKLITGALTALFALLLIGAFILAGRPIVEFCSDAERVRAWVNAGGLWSRIAFAGMVALQVVVAFIPGEPLEICAGYAFGIWEGTALCILGSLIGGALVFLFVRTLGVKAAEVFFSREKLDKLSFLKDEKKVAALFFLIFLIPGTPKDILCYVAGLTAMRLPAWLLISGAARIPSIVTSTVGGDALGVGDVTFAAVVFAATLLISAGGLFIYTRLIKSRREKANGTH